MNYDEQQGVAYAVGKLYDLLDKHAGNEPSEWQVFDYDKVFSVEVEHD